MSTTVTCAQPRLTTELLDAPSRVDRVIFGSDDPFTMSHAHREDLLIEVVREAVIHHVQHNALYAAFCRRRGFHPDMIQTLQDLNRVPQIPTAVFKRVELLSTPEYSIVRRFTSSGTSGSRSFVARDEVTLQRLIGSMRAAVPFLEPWVPRHARDDEFEFVNLGPRREDGGDLWFSYVMALAEVMAPTGHYVRNGVLCCREAAETVANRIRSGRLVGIVGPPKYVLYLLDALADDGSSVRADDRVFVITGGGWKDHQSEAMRPDDFRLRVAEALQLRSSEQIRDALNQVELNSVFFECQHHRKHVPPWVYAVTRSADALEALPFGQPGLLSYVDATAMSYPCFIITDDVGTVFADDCPCGRTGQTIAFERRIERSANEGCAIKMYRNLTAEKGHA